MTYGEIGEYFNNLDSSSIKRRVVKVKQEIAVNRYLREKLLSIESRL